MVETQNRNKMERWKGVWADFEDCIFLLFRLLYASLGVEGIPRAAWSRLIHSEILTQEMEILDIMVLFDYALQR